jgi:hypothetical protein
MVLNYLATTAADTPDITLVLRYFYLIYPDYASPMICGSRRPATDQRYAESHKTQDPGTRVPA